MGKKLVFKAENNHVVSCGEPPKIAAGKEYCGYYENIYGEQWVFVGNVKEEKFKLYGGDIHWENVQEVDLNDPNGKFDLILNTGELMWLKACMHTLMELIDDKNGDWDAAAERDRRVRRYFALEIEEMKGK